MANVQENKTVVKELIKKVKDHPMCLSFKELTSENKYQVLYPAAMCLDGCQASFSIGKIVALERMLNAMERHWKESGIN